ncbi:hypothetical protein CAPTEDRAFT_190786 [Capitella teleta]|uniref:G-protein coupled receptors family 1 profile domain-containing protein n=1 Tax=Capitella teleta TaxID=283909 RepID=R7VFA6_CAPTE|nr:hypothetical protein CAPTEDRAFT_190786 [Capitella teleta]|eukprot:ELU14355.1 hypothetical protein CAPTEDRAFT_190786 [Capitella teleta]
MHATADAHTETAAELATQPPLTADELKECSDFYTFSGTIIALTIVFGITGNILTIHVFRTAKNRTSTMYLISNLAVVDCLVTFIFLPVMFPPTFYSVATFYVAYLSNLAYTLNQISVCFTCLLVWQRYVSVCKPHTAKTWQKISTLRILAILSATFSIVIYLPGFFRFHLDKYADGTYHALPTKLGSNMLFYCLHTVIIINFISYFLPMVVIAFASICLIRAFRQEDKFVSSQQAKRELTLSVIVIVLFFIFLQIFRPIRYLLMWLFNPYTEALRCQGPLMHYSQVTPYATILNSSVNFVIYVVCARGFRKKIKTKNYKACSNNI